MESGIARLSPYHVNHGEDIMNGGSSGGGFLSSQAGWNALDPANLFGHSSSSSIGSNILDPGNVLGMNSAVATNAANAANNPTTIGNLGAASLMPRYYSPTSFSAPQLTGGMFNQMAQQGAGAVYTPTLATGASFGNGIGPTTAIPPAQTTPGHPSGSSPTMNLGANGLGGYSYGAPNLGSGNGGQTINMGGQNIVGDTNYGGSAGINPSLAAGIGGMLFGLPGGLAGGALAKLTGGNAFSGAGIPGYKGPATFNGASNLQPTNVTIPKTQITTPPLIINPATGSPYGTPYYSSKVGQLAAFHQAIANGQMESEAQNSLINKNNAGRNSRA
jgi:hypothetical protein